MTVRIDKQTRKRELLGLDILSACYLSTLQNPPTTPEDLKERLPRTWKEKGGTFRCIIERVMNESLPAGNACTRTLFSRESSLISLFLAVQT